MPSLIRQAVPALIAGVIVFVLITVPFVFVLLFGNELLAEVDVDVVIPVVLAPFTGALGFLAAVYVGTIDLWQAEEES